MEVPGFRGLYENQLGVIYDLRPLPTAPTFNALFKNSQKDLVKVLVNCLKGQLEALGTLVNPDETVKRQIMKLLGYWTSQAEKYAN